MAARARLNRRERHAMSKLLEAYAEIQSWGLIANEDELARAIHSVQQFIIGHMLHRIEPGHWSAWFRA